MGSFLQQQNTTFSESTPTRSLSGTPVECSHVAPHACVAELNSSVTTVFPSHKPADSMSAALRGASDEDFERSAHWLADIIKGYLFPKTAVRFLRRVVEIIQAQPGYQHSPEMCQVSALTLIATRCARVLQIPIGIADASITRWKTCVTGSAIGSPAQTAAYEWQASTKMASKAARVFHYKQGLYMHMDRGNSRNGSVPFMST